MMTLHQQTRHQSSCWSSY